MVFIIKTDTATTENHTNHIQISALITQQLSMDIYPEFLNGPEHKAMNGKYVSSCPGAM